MNRADGGTIGTQSYKNVRTERATVWSAIFPRNSVSPNDASLVTTRDGGFRHGNQNNRRGENTL